MNGLTGVQLSEAVNLISKQDFPEQWPELLPQLVEKLSVEDFNVINGVLETALAIFNRWVLRLLTHSLGD